MQSLIFPPNIASEMNDVDHRHHHNITPNSLYTSIRVVSRLVNELDSNIVVGAAVAITHMNTTTHVNIVDLPHPNNESQVVSLPAGTDTTKSPQ